MATFSQWLKHSKITRVAWVCGPEPVLVQSVLSGYVKGLSAVHPVAMWGHQKLWDNLLTAPAGPQLVVVREAESLHDLALLPHLLGDEFDASYVVFVSAEDDFRRDGKQLIEPLAALRDSKHGQLIRCCVPADEESAADIVASWWPGAGRNVAGALLAACGGSLSGAYAAAGKAVAAGVAPDIKVVPAVCLHSPAGSYADLLLAGKRRDAMNAAQEVGPGEAGGVIGLLASRLALLPLVREAQQRRETPQETVRRLHADAWVLRQLRQYAGDYDPARVARCRELLAMAETAWRSGSRDGVLEAVAALW